jgi:hypothetical protein
MRFISICLIFCCQMTSGYQILHGQRSAAMQISIKSGLPSNVVYEIKIDSRGFLWAATDKGVVRYDGRKFRVFTTDDGILSNDNFKIIIDKDDNVWLYALTGISKIDKTFRCHVISRHKAYYSFFVMNKKNEIITYQIDSFDANNGAQKSAFGIIKNNTVTKVPFYYPSSVYKKWFNAYHYFINDTLFILGSDKNKNKLLYFLDVTSNKITISDRTYIHKITHNSESDFDNTKKELFQINSTYSIVLKKTLIYL